MTASRTGGLTAVYAGCLGAALMPTDWEAFWYQGAVLSETVRLARRLFRRPDFLDWVLRLDALLLLTTDTP